MTLRELNRHYDLRQQLAKAQGILASLRETAGPGAQVLTGMPHATGVQDKVGDLAIEITEAEADVERLQQRICHDEPVVIAYINSIEDFQTRMIFRLRFIRCLTWGEVAKAIGGRNTEGSVQKICYRYLAAQGCTDVSGYVC